MGDSENRSKEEWQVIFNWDYDELSKEEKANVDNLVENRRRGEARDDSVWGLYKHLNSRLIIGSNYTLDAMKGGKSLVDVKKYLAEIRQILTDIDAFDNMDWKKWDYKKAFELEDLRKLGDYSEK